MTRPDRSVPLGLERKHEPLISHRAFFLRVAWMGAAALGLVAFGLSVGAIGYRATEGWSWLDSTLNAAMILTGMGPVDELRTNAGKVFAIAYALFSGVVFVSAIALVLAPVAHRILHAFHMEDDAAERTRAPKDRERP
ncbi:MAG: hypothetical protein K8S98_14110 [Planctomycetes bacterium]|nr:hypothetical protein [Planctomycetota bacterium]